MATFRRYYVDGGCYFFTLVTHQRQSLLIEHHQILRDSFRRVQRRHPFGLDAIVVLPDHLHCIIRLPEGDSDYPTRIRLLKHGFSRAMSVDEDQGRRSSRVGERGIWQRRYWEHVIRDEEDYRHHMDYIHFNPVKHAYVKQVVDWPFSSFHRWVSKGMYEETWGGEGMDTDLELE